MRCPTCLRDLDPQNTDLIGFAQESWSSDLSHLSGNIMDDQQQRRFRAMQDSMGKSALRFGNNGSSVTKPDVKNFEPPYSNSLPPSEQNFEPLNLYCRKCWKPRPTHSTAWISSWPNSTGNPQTNRSPTATSLANEASRAPPSISRTSAYCASAGSAETTMIADIPEFSRP